jgi:RNA polymerase sigma-70 factor (ECF subfamily)
MPQEKDTIEELVYSFQLGEEKGFTYFFNAFYPALLYFTFRITKDKAAARDIVEDAFIKIWKRHTTFFHHKQIKSWLYTTVRNAGIDWLREQQVSLAHDKEIASMPVSSEIDTMQELIRAEVTREIYSAIKDLPPRCQQVFKLLYIQGKSMKEAALELELSVHTVKNHRARGLVLLKKRIPDLL